MEMKWNQNKRLERKTKDPKTVPDKMKYLHFFFKGNKILLIELKYTFSSWNYNKMKFKNLQNYLISPYFNNLQNNNIISLPNASNN